jgi:hypothetical protein
MTNPTSNFGWQMPTSTDLVTDLPADFEVFGQAVDTDFVDLLGGTTGQVLSKTTNTDLDFTWVTPQVGDITAVNVTSPITGGGSAGAVTIGISAATTSVVGAVQLSDSTSTTSSVLASTPTATKAAYDLADAAIAKSTVTTAGDIIYRNATVPVRLGIGTAGQVLAVNSGATAPEWKTIAAGGKVLQVIMGSTATTASNSTTSAADTGLTATITPSSATSKVLVLVNHQGCYKSGANSQNALNLKLLRGATTVQQIATNLFYNTTVGELSGSVSAAYLDSPATTSATTYKTQFYNYVAAASVSVQIQNVDLSTIILLEIGA